MGASSGIGRETALQLARRGARLVVAARDGEALDSRDQAVKAESGQLAAVTADTSRMDDVQRWRTSPSSTTAAPTPGCRPPPSPSTPASRTRRPRSSAGVLEVNVLGNVHAALVALPHLRGRGGGAFISISSVEARQAFPYHAAYAASKHAVDRLLEALRVE